MTIDQLLDRLREHHVLDRTAQINPDTELLMSGLIDSFGVVSLVAWLEEESGQNIAPTELLVENFETPQAIFQMVQAKGAN